MVPVDFLIVGAGIAGVSVAWQLADQHTVILLEAEDQPGFHATGRSAAFFLATYGNAAIRALTAASRDFFDQPPPGFTEHPLLEPRGCLIIAGTNQRAGLREQFAELREGSTELSFQPGEFALERVPVLRSEQVSACIWEPDAQRIDVNALMQGYLRGCRQQGAQIVTNARVQSTVRADDHWTVRTTTGEFHGRVIVNAAGAWADEVADLAGAERIGFTPLRRTACIIETEPAVACGNWPAVTDLDESFYFMPDAGRLLLSPADETPAEPGDAYPDDIDVAMAVDRFESVTSLQVRRVVQQWAGLRTFGPDRSPVVGFDASVAGFFWLAGQGGYGIQTAPELSRVAADMLRSRLN
ncbi:MAG: FAD-dependent oxidoreductase [Gammaproteobacteria bacterium]|nr:FAD-dependent oxidoreductase [Gammaproteobacteria bacterium]